MASASDQTKHVVTGYPAPAGGGGSAYPYSDPHPPQRLPAFSYGYYSNGVAPPPPPQPAYYPPPPPPQAYAPSRDGLFFIRRLLIICIVFFILFGLISLVLWLVFRPRVPEVSVVSATISGFNVSAADQRLNATFDIDLSFHNPSGKMGIDYDRLRAAVLYGYDTISETSLPPFYQAKGNATTITARLVASGEYVGSDIVKSINDDRGRSGGTVRFDFRVSSWVRFRSGVWGTRRHVLRVYCDNIPIGFKNGTDTTGSLVGSSSEKKCMVHL